MGREIGMPEFLRTQGLQYGQWWDFLSQPPVQSLQLNTVTAGANANDDVAATVVGIAPMALRVLGGYVSVSANSTAIDANNTSAVVVAGGGTTLLTLTRTTDFVADTPASLGTPSSYDVAAGAKLTVAITNGTNADLNSAVVNTVLSIADKANYPAPGLTLIDTDGGTAVISDGVKGVLVLTTGAADNSEMYLATNTETVKLAAGKSFVGEACIAFTNANTTANVFIGFMNAFAANALVDTGGGPKATGDYIGLWCVDGSDYWYCGAQSNGTATPTTDTLGTPNTSADTGATTTYSKVRAEVDCLSSTKAQATFTVDGVCIGSVHFTYASATEMQFGIGVKTGEAVAQALYIDYMGYEQVR